MQVSKDNEHTAILEQLRNIDIARPVTEQLVDEIQHMVLTSDDVHTMPNWCFAPLAVCGNGARQIVNHDQAIQFATQYGLKDIQWYLEASAYPNNVIEYIYEKN
jgi:hypothetical protein